MFLNTNNELIEREIKKIISFSVPLKTIRYLGISSTQEDFYTKTYKTLMKEIEDNTNKWKDTYVHGLEELILLKCVYYPKPSTDSVKYLSKFQWHFSQ